MVDKVIEYGYKKVGFILDRGYFSKKNIQYMDENRYAFIIMVKGKKALVSSLVEGNLGSFETNRDCSIRSYRVYGKTVQATLYDDDTSERYFHIYFNPSKQASERESFEQMLDKKNAGVYSTTIKLAPGTYQYKFVIDGTWCADPECADFVQNDHGTLNSVITVK